MQNTIHRTVSRIYLIDYLKAIAILFVIITHCHFSNFQRSHVLIVFVINMAVPLFILIMGYNYAKSFINHNIVTIRSMYNIRILTKRILRVSIPFCIIFILEYLVYKNTTMNSHHILTYFIKGGIGPGSYYYPVVLQLIVLFPLIYIIVKKYKDKGLILLIFLESVCILLSVVTDFDLKTYRLLAFRYISLISCGAYMATNRKNINAKNMKILLCIGVLLLTILHYTGNEYSCYPYLKKYWGASSGITVMLYVFPIFYLIFEKYERKIFNGICGNLLLLIGKASWHIMLFQMLYYCSKFFVNKHNLFLDVIINLVVCSAGGIIFYLIDELLISKHLLKYLKTDSSYNQ